MRKVMTMAVLGLFVSGSVFAAGSEIKGSTITNESQVKEAANLAISTGAGEAVANQGSIKIKGAKISDSNITNKSKVERAANLAISTGVGDTRANQGSIDIE
ncbi:MAG: hypothetical protein K0U68_02185 [Gammaproteobacteria bacterium]|nr:hypothetical protein [Gammaproteobacteria bacterium]MCH9696889.1 hypothetical protein [Gammaproteobacteria bacterium]